MNPILGFVRTLLLFVTLRTHFIRRDASRKITMEDGCTFRVFRHVKIQSKDTDPPQGVFIVRFKPKNMTVRQNIRFSLFPMLLIEAHHGPFLEDSDKASHTPPYRAR